MIGHRIIKRVSGVPEHIEWGGGIIYGRWEINGKNNDFTFEFNCTEPERFEWWGHSLEHAGMVNASSILIEGCNFEKGSVLFLGPSCWTRGEGRYFVKFRFRNINPRGACLYRKTDIMWHLEDDQS